MNSAPAPISVDEAMQTWSPYEDKIMLAAHDFLAALPGDPWRLLKTRGVFYVMTPDLMIEVRQLKGARR